MAKMIAKDLEDFNAKMSKKIVDALNNTEDGEKVRRMLVEACEKINPNMTKEEWTQKKQLLIIAIFMRLIEQHPDLKEEYAEHIYNKLREMDE